MMAELQACLAQMNGQVKLRLQGLEKLQDILQQTSLQRDSISELVECLSNLLTDNNYKVAQYSLRALDALVLTQREAVKPFLNHFFDPLVERLGDMKQPVRMDAFPVLLSLMEVLKPESVVERVGKFWNHKNWRIRHGLLQTFAEAVSKHGTDVLLSKSSETNLIKQALRLTEDPDSTVRDAAVEFLEEAHRVTGDALIDIVKRSHLRSAVIKEILARLLPEGEHQRTSSLEEVAAVPSPDFARTALIVRGMSGLQLQAGHELSPHHHDQNQPRVPDVSVMHDGFNAHDGPMALVTSEKELRSELERIAARLAPTVKWDERNNAMLRLEALINGGAVLFDQFGVLVLKLQDALAQQITDRRSAVVRQVCRLLSVMAAAMEMEFEMLAASVLPLLFKVLVITIQVMADAADVCIHHIVHYCHSPRLLHLFLHAATKDKNAKIRQCCAAYLVQLLEEWHPSIIMRHLDVVEDAICVAAQGTLPQARLFGRYAYAIYTAQQPHRAIELLGKMASGLQSKLLETARTYKPGSALSVKNLQFVPPPVSRSSSQCELNTGLQSSSNFDVDNQLTHTPHAASTYSSSMDGTSVSMSDGLGSTTLSTRHSLFHGSIRADPYIGLSLLKLVSAVQGDVKPWTAKVSLLTALSKHIEEGGRNVHWAVEQMQPKLLECLEDAHCKVVCACLKLVCSMLHAASAVVEPNADKLLPALFLRLVDQKEQVRELAHSAISGCGTHFSADNLLCALTRTIDVARVPKARVAALEFATMFLGHDTTVGAPSNTVYVRRWLSHLVPLLGDKSGDVRKAASVALSCTYRNMDDGVVLQYFASAPGQHALAMKKALSDNIPDLEAEAQRYVASRNATSISSAHATSVLIHARDLPVLPPAESMCNNPSIEVSIAPAADTLTYSSMAALETSHEKQTSQAGCIGLLLAQFQYTPSTEILSELAHLAAVHQASVWEPHISQVVLILVQACQHEETVLQEAALNALRQLVCSHGPLLADLTRTFLPSVLACCGGSNPEVAFAARTNLESMLCSLPVSTCMAVLVECISAKGTCHGRSSTSAEVLNATLRGLQHCVRQLPMEELREVTSVRLFPWLLRAFEDSRPDVRKAVTFCFVQLWLRLGDWMMPYLDKLGASQLNLVTIYYDRAKHHSIGHFPPISA